MQPGEKGIYALFYEKSNIGKRFKASKKRYTWKVDLEGEEHALDMYVSELSGKRKVILDGEVKYTGKAQTGIYFQFPIKVDKHILCIVQQESEWDLKIDNSSFSRLFMHQRAGVNRWDPSEYASEPQLSASFKPTKPQWGATSDAFNYESGLPKQAKPVLSEDRDWTDHKSEVQRPDFGRKTKDREPLESTDFPSNLAGNEFSSPYQWDQGPTRPQRTVSANDEGERSDIPQRREKRREEWDMGGRKKEEDRDFDIDWGKEWRRIESVPSGGGRYRPDQGTWKNADLLDDKDIRNPGQISSSQAKRQTPASASIPEVDFFGNPDQKSDPYRSLPASQNLNPASGTLSLSGGSRNPFNTKFVQDSSFPAQKPSPAAEKKPSSGSDLLDFDLFSPQTQAYPKTQVESPPVEGYPPAMQPTMMSMNPMANPMAAAMMMQTYMTGMMNQMMMQSGGQPKRY